MRKHRAESLRVGRALLVPAPFALMPGRVSYRELPLMLLQRAEDVRAESGRLRVDLNRSREYGRTREEERPLRLCRERQ